MERQGTCVCPTTEKRVARGGRTGAAPDKTAGPRPPSGLAVAHSAPHRREGTRGCGGTNGDDAPAPLTKQVGQKEKLTMYREKFRRGCWKQLFPQGHCCRESAELGAGVCPGPVFHGAISRCRGNEGWEVARVRPPPHGFAPLSGSPFSQSNALLPSGPRSAFCLLVSCL